MILSTILSVILFDELWNWGVGAIKALGIAGAFGGLVYVGKVIIKICTDWSGLKMFKTQTEKWQDKHESAQKEWQENHVAQQTDDIHELRTAIAESQKQNSEEHQEILKAIIEAQKK